MQRNKNPLLSKSELLILHKAYQTMDSGNRKMKNLSGDVSGGTAAMLVAIPSTIAYGLMSYAPLGVEFASMAAIGAILGTVVFSIIAPLWGGTKGLISAPSAAAATVLSLFVSELVKKNGGTNPELIPVYVIFLTVFAGIIQFLIGNFGGGKFIKYIPYPVITGYLTGVSVLLFIGQLPKFLGISRDANILDFKQWRWESICIGSVSFGAMLLSSKFIKRVPPVIVALLSGIATFLIIAFFNRQFLVMENNPFIVGKLSISTSEIFSNISHRWSLMPKIDYNLISTILVPGVTLALLLSITTLNTCIVLDGITYSNHNPKKELMAQGVGNMTSALFGGIPGAALMTSTLENINSGAKTRNSVIIFGISSLLVLIFLGKFLAWIPLAALAGILIVIALRMIDPKIFDMLKNTSTIFDFVVIISVVVAAVYFGLIKAAGVGIAMAIFLFLREQMGISVIRRKLFGNQIFSKKIRLNYEREILDRKGDKTIILELQGQLFFGTTDQLFSKLEKYYVTCKYVVLDMRRIQSVDYTAAIMLKKIHARVTEQNSNLIFASVPETLPNGQNVRKYITDLGLTEQNNLKFFDDLDAALIWIEDEILGAEDKTQHDNEKILELHELELFKGFPPDTLSLLNDCLEERVYQPGQLIFKTGSASDEIYFVRKGTIKLDLPLTDNKQYHLLTIGRGGVFGEMAFIDTIDRSADARALDTTHLYILSREKFEQFMNLHPDIACKFFERLAFLIAGRLRRSNKELKVFQEN